jgi:hypothetical protein
MVAVGMDVGVARLRRLRAVALTDPSSSWVVTDESDRSSCGWSASVNLSTNSWLPVSTHSEKKTRFLGARVDLRVGVMVTGEVTEETVHMERST